MTDPDFSQAGRRYGRSRMKERYNAYLLSPEWDAKRKSAKRRAKNRCQVCNAGHLPLHTHHRTYENIYKEKPADLTVLCAVCHALFHDRLPKVSHRDLDQDQFFRDQRKDQRLREQWRELEESVADELKARGITMDEWCEEADRELREMAGLPE